ncbi:hypothetical protein ACPA1U_25040, partial [Ectopseudomonas hydrolytica]
MSEVIATRRLVTRLLVVVVVMFCFGIFVLPPFYDAMCRVFGINGKTAICALCGVIKNRLRWPPRSPRTAACSMNWS